MMKKVTRNAKRKTTPLNASGGAEHRNKGITVISLAGLSGKFNHFIPIGQLQEG